MDSEKDQSSPDPDQLPLLRLDADEHVAALQSLTVAPAAGPRATLSVELVALDQDDDEPG